jgi:hypothetical protein
MGAMTTLYWQSAKFPELVLSVARIVKLKVPGALPAPEIVPSGDNVMPGGSEPACRLQVYVELPLVDSPMSFPIPTDSPKGGGVTMANPDAADELLTVSE